eukprot:m.113398 g.113398  ORF g.113398 m.113398 type:complete len:94 (+) comp15356_c6_seq4:550-831(+)
MMRESKSQEAKASEKQRVMVSNECDGWLYFGIFAQNAIEIKMSTWSFCSFTASPLLCLIPYISGSLLPLSDTYTCAHLYIYISISKCIYICDG